MSAIDINVELLREFERKLDPRYPEKCSIPVKILGYGEISTVFELEAAPGLALKRMPIFANEAELQQYEEIYRRYNEILINEVGIKIPPYASVHFTDDEGRIIYFLVQKKLPGEAIGNRVIQSLSAEAANSLVLAVLREIKKVVEFNRKNAGRLEVAIDGQISNWAFLGFNPDEPGNLKNVELMYIDTSTPFIRVNGVEQLDPELFLRSAPSFLVWLIRLLFLNDVMNRYYNFRLVTLDIIANFFKEQRPDLIQGLIVTANNFFKNELHIKPLTDREVKSYYREDAWIWRLYLSFRKADRFLHGLTGKKYLYILPGKIKR